MLTHRNIVYFGTSYDADGLPVPFRNYVIYADLDLANGMGRAWISCLSEQAPGETGATPILAPNGIDDAIAAAVRSLDAIPSNQALRRRSFI